MIQKLFPLMILLLWFNQANAQVSFTITDTQQGVCYDEQGNVISCPASGAAFLGQDAQYAGIQPSFTDNMNGTITDNNTGLIWQKGYQNTHTQYDDAITYCDGLSIGGYDDWRLPTIKELYSISDWRGEIINGQPELSTPYIDTDYFDFQYPEMVYAGQYWSITKYIIGGVQIDNLEAAFGFNFSDGHIKGYETGYYFNGTSGAPAPGNYVRCVRGEENVYGVNNFEGNGNGTVTDKATNLMWTKGDNGTPSDWEHALSYCENLDHAGYQDWRLPNIKELQSIVDYSKTAIPAADDIFNFSNDDSWFWSSTTHGDNKEYACYICFGYAYSKDNSDATTYYDWHGAGAMRSDPKYGIPSDWVSESVNAADSVKVANYARCVRDYDSATGAINLPDEDNIQVMPNPSSGVFTFTTVYESAITVRDITGKTICKMNSSAGLVSVDLSNYDNGIYFALIENFRVTKTLKLIKN